MTIVKGSSLTYLSHDCEDDDGHEERVSEESFEDIHRVVNGASIHLIEHLFKHTPHKHIY